MMTELTAEEELIEALRECLSWMECDCGHPACKRCKATKEAQEALHRFTTAPRECGCDQYAGGVPK